MSIYGYILCNECKERHWIKDADTEINGDPAVVGRFFEVHRGHALEYAYEDDERTYCAPGWQEFRDPRERLDD